MIIAASLIWAVGAAQAAPGVSAPPANAPSVLGSEEEEVQSLAVNLDNAIKVCSEESARAAARKAEIGKVEKRAMDAGLLAWITEPPPALKEEAEGRPARFGRWLDPHATIWMIAYDQAPTCRILVGGTPWAMTVRPALYAKIQDDRYWIADGPEQAIEGSLMRATFHADTPAAVNVRPMITVVAPSVPTEGGAQLSIGVHIVSKEEK